MTQPYQRITDAFAAATGAHPLTEEEADALLELAKRVARSGDDRRAAPLVCYLAGQLLGGKADPERRVEQVREMLRLYPEAG
jgi:hypothetical protein